MQWRPVPVKKYPGWALRRVVTGGYKTPYKTKNRKGETVYANAPRLCRYDITRDGQLFFSANTKRQVMQVIKRYSQLT